jgi:predicted dienelactone hydrolase
MRTRSLWLCMVLTSVGCGDSAAPADEGRGDAAADGAMPGEQPVQGYVPNADPEVVGPFSAGVAQRLVSYTGVSGDDRPLDSLIWYPTEAPGTEDRDLGGTVDAPLAAGGPFPLIAFSHGSGGEPNQSRYLVKYLASHGFVVVAPPHPGSRASECGLNCGLPAASTQNRPHEIMAALDFVLAENEQAGALLEGAVDETRVGMTGHSYGGLTTLLVMGGEYKDRFRAGAAMAPVANDAATVNISAPFMLLAAERDTLVPIASTRSTYTVLPDDTERYFLWFEKAGHFAYNDSCVVGCSEVDSLKQARAHELINSYITAFLQTHVGRAEPSDLLAADPEIEFGTVRLEVGDLSF